MFKFVYVLAAGECPPDADALRPFAGIQADASVIHPAVVGRRIEFADIDRVTGPPAYLILGAPGGFVRPAEIGLRLRDAAERWPATVILIANGGSFRRATELWTLMEAANHPRVKVAWDGGTHDRGIQHGELLASPSPDVEQSPGVVVPTLNLRLGAVVLHAWDGHALASVRRLGGIGFEGWLVIDPPASEDRVESAIALVDHTRNLLEPPKPAKKTTVPAR